MREARHTLSNLHRSLTARGSYEWYFDCDWYGSLKTGIETELTLIFFARTAWIVSRELPTYCIAVAFVAAALRPFVIFFV
jgi:hypothetical protein